MSLQPSPVNVRQHVIHGPQNRKQVRDHPAPAHPWQHLHVRKRRSTDSCPVRDRTAVADQVIAIVSFCGLYRTERLTRRNDWTPTNVEKVGDERLDIVHRPVLEWRRGQGMIRLVWPVGHVVDTLLDDPEALPHFFHADNGAVVAVAVDAGRDIEFELFVTGIRLLLTEIPLHAASAQVRTRSAPFDCLRRVERTHALRPRFEYAVAQHGAIVLSEPRRQVLDESAEHSVPALWKILLHAADTEPVRMHACAADGFDNFEGTLAVVKRVENR